MGCFTKCDAFSSTLAVCNDAVWTSSASPPACDDILLGWKLLLSCQRFTYIVEYIYKITHCKDYKFRMSTTRILVFSLVNSICKSELQRLHSEHKVSECMKKLWKHDFLKILFKIKGHLYMHAKICYMSVKSLNHTFLHVSRYIGLLTPSLRCEFFNFKSFMTYEY